MCDFRTTQSLIWSRTYVSTTKKKFATFLGMAGNIINSHGSKILAKGPNAERQEGDLEGIVVMIEFVSLEAAKKIYISDEYQAVKVVCDQCSDTD